MKKIATITALFLLQTGVFAGELESNNNTITELDSDSLIQTLSERVKNINHYTTIKDLLKDKINLQKFQERCLQNLTEYIEKTTKIRDPHDFIMLYKAKLNNPEIFDCEGVKNQMVEQVKTYISEEDFNEMNSLICRITEEMETIERNPR